jgi:hypothetical protein
VAQKQQRAATMTSLRRFTCDDLFTFNNVNLDILTETYNLPFYLQAHFGAGAFGAAAARAAG